MIIKKTAGQIIEIGEGCPPDGNYAEYKITTNNTNRTLTFTAQANNKSYEIRQFGTSKITNIVFEKDVKTTVIFNGIDVNNGFIIELTGGSEIKLLLSGKNTINTGHITALPGSVLIIDSADFTGSENGELNVVSYNNNSACIGGKGNNLTYVVEGGKIIINGGTINVSRNAGNKTIPIAAAIGGGQFEIGHVTINGGNVTADNINYNAPSSQNEGGAAIGGAFGNNSYGEVYINGGTVTAITCSDDFSPIYNGGAAIGGGALSGNEVNSKLGNIVIITRGNIKATAYDGAAIGGGYKRPGNVVISGDHENINITAESYNGASIGDGSDYSGELGFVKITDGTIYAYNANNAGIGGNFAKSLVYDISHTANIVVISKGSGEQSGAGIKGVGKNQGDAFFVNLYNNTLHNINSSTSLMDIKRIVVIDVETNKFIHDIPVNKIKSYFLIFSFTTGSISEGTYKVYIDYGYGLTPLVRTDNIVHGRPNEIYSVNTMGAYEIHDFKESEDYFLMRDYIPFGANVGDGEDSIVFITEKYVDKYGNDIEGVSQKTSIMSYNKLYNTPPIEIPEYIAIGFKPEQRPDKSGKDYTLLPFTNNPLLIKKDMDIYIVYKFGATLTVSKKVSGFYSDKTKDFAFTVSLFSNASGTPFYPDNKFNYMITNSSGTVLGAPSIMGNNINFNLKHGDKIIIDGIPINSWIAIEEAYDDFYDTTYKDGDNPNQIETGITTGQPFNILFDRDFVFTNASRVVVPTGVDSGDIGSIILLPALLVIFLLIPMIFIKFRRGRVG